MSQEERNESPTRYYERVHRAQKAPRATTERRLSLICAQRGITEKELQKFRGKRRNSQVFNYRAFAKKYQASLDWLLDGDLRGLLRTAQGRVAPREIPREIRRAQDQEFSRLLTELPANLRPSVLSYLRHLAEGGPTNFPA